MKDWIKYKNESINDISDIEKSNNMYNTKLNINSDNLDGVYTHNNVQHINIDLTDFINPLHVTINVISQNQHRIMGGMSGLAWSL